MSKIDLGTVNPDAFKTLAAYVVVSLVTLES